MRGIHLLLAESESIGHARPMAGPLNQLDRDDPEARRVSEAGARRCESVNPKSQSLDR